MQDDFRVNGVIPGNQNQSAFTPTADGGFIVTWTTADTGDGTGTNIHAAYYDHFGNKAGNFNVNTNTAGDQSQSAVAGLSDGRVVVVWTTAGQNGTEIHGQIFNSAGAVGGGAGISAPAR